MAWLPVFGPSNVPTDANNACDFILWKRLEHDTDKRQVCKTVAICVEAVNSTARDECDIIKRQAIRAMEVGGGGEVRR